MKLTEYEVRIKQQVEQDYNNPEIYNNLQKMIELFLKRKKACNSNKDYEDLSYIIAGDLYLKIINGTRITYYLGYLNKVYHQYTEQYYKEIHPEYISYDSTDNFQQFIYDTSALEDFKNVDYKIYLEQVSSMLDQIMEQSCKYDYNSAIFLNLKLSLILSLLRGHKVYFHLNTEQQSYLDLILINFNNKIHKEIKI